MAYASPMKIANGLVLDFTVDNADTAADTFLGLNANGEVTQFASVPRARVSGGGNITEATSSVLTITGGTAAVLTSGLTIQVKLAGAAQSGYLSTTDWNTFNNKLGTSLTSAYIYVGNGSNVATGVAVSGDISLTNTGNAQIVAGAIVDADVNASAAIAVSKLEALTANRVLGSNGSGVIQALNTATYPSLTELAYAKGVTSSIQTQLNNRLTVTLSSPTNGDVITYNGSAWVNSPSSTGVPVGGTTAQILRKIDVTNYNTEWHTLVAADITDVSAIAAELNLLDGVTTTTAQFNFLNTVSGNVQDQLDSKQSIALTENNIWVGNASNIAAALAAGTNGYVLTSVSGVPTWVSPGVGGTVTSVAASGGTTGMSFTGSPVTTSGTLTLTGTLAIANGGTGLTALGTANQLIRVNAGATAIEYFTPTYITSPDFADNVFRISDNSDSTKKIAFEASGITTGTVRTFTAPNNSGTLALTSDLNSWLSGTLTANTDISRTVGNDVGTLSVYGNVIGLFNENTVSGRINSVQVTNNGIEITNTLSGGLFGINDTGVSIDVGSDATGDTYYRNSSGYLTRLGVGTNGHVLTLAGGIPSWAAPSGGAALTNGNGTTANGSAVDLGGTISTDIDFIADGTKYFRIGDSGTNQGVLDFRVFAKDYVNIRAGEFSSGNYNGLQIIPSGTTSGTVIESFDSSSNTTEAIIGSGAGQYYGFTVRTGNPTASTKLQIRPDGIWQVNLGSDATGDTYYRNSSGYFTRLAAGTNGHVLTLAGGIPSWAAPSGGSWALTGTSTLTGAVTIAGSTTNTLQFNFGSLGTTYSNVFMLNNPTAAAAGSQQISPPFLRRGNGWKTNATAASQTVDFIDYVTPVQGAASPTGYWSMYSSINGGTLGEQLRVQNNGSVYLVGGGGVSPALYFGTGIDALITRGLSGTQGIDLYGPASAANIYSLSISSFNSNNYTPTSGTGGMLRLPGNFTPSSGSANFYGVNATGTINMTGTSSGNVFVYGNNQTVTAAKGNYTGFYHNPSVTSITGDHLSFHAVSGNVLLPASSYININSTVGSSGYGFRDNAGTMEFKNSGGSWAAFGGITNSAANTELMMSNGTNAVASGLFVSTLGNLDLGTGLSGSTRTISALGSATDIGLTLYTKGAGTLEIGGGNASLTRINHGDAATSTATRMLSLTKRTSGTAAAGFGLNQTWDIESGSGNLATAVGFTATWSVATDTLETSSYVLATRKAGASFDAFSINGDNMALLSGVPANWQSMERGVYLPNRTAAPTAGIANGVALFAEDSNSSSEFYVMPESGAKVNISGLLEPVTESGTSFSLNETHRNKVVLCTNSGAITVTVNAGKAAGWNCLLLATNATGTISLTASGTTINGTTATTVQFETLSIVHYGSENYLSKLG